jgi:hypothetical protein
MVGLLRLLGLTPCEPQGVEGGDPLASQPPRPVLLPPAVHPKAEEELVAGPVRLGNSGVPVLSYELLEGGQPAREVLRVRVPDEAHAVECGCLLDGRRPRRRSCRRLSTHTPRANPSSVRWSFVTGACPWVVTNA